jgi:hypothetical protein
VLVRVQLALKVLRWCETVLKRSISVVVDSTTYIEDIPSAHNLGAVEKRKCCRHVTVRGAANVLSRGINGCMRGIMRRAIRTKQ